MQYPLYVLQQKTQRARLSSVFVLFSHRWLFNVIDNSEMSWPHVPDYETTGRQLWDFSKRVTFHAFEHLRSTGTETSEGGGCLGLLKIILSRPYEVMVWQVKYGMQVSCLCINKLRTRAEKSRIFKKKSKTIAHAIIYRCVVVYFCSISDQCWKTTRNDYRLWFAIWKQLFDWILRRCINIRVNSGSVTILNLFAIKIATCRCRVFYLKTE